MEGLSTVLKHKLPKGSSYRHHHYNYDSHSLPLKIPQGMEMESGP